jgi:hypothetical protein
MSDRRPTRDECVAAAGQALADAIARRDSLDPRAAALEAYEPGSIWSSSVAEIEARIRARRVSP